MNKSPVVAVLSGVWRGVRAVLPTSIKSAVSRELMLVVMAGALVFYGIALFGFHPADPSPVTSVFPPVPVLNGAGVAGATLMGLLVYWMGVAVVLLPVPFMMASAMIVVKRSGVWSVSRWIGWTLFGMTIAMVATQTWQHVVYENIPLAAGGVVGEVVNKAFTRWFGPKGSTVVMVVTALISVILVFQRAILEPSVRWVASRWSDRREKLPIKLPATLAARLKDVFSRNTTDSVAEESVATSDESIGTVGDELPDNAETPVAAKPAAKVARAVRGAIAAATVRRTYTIPPLSIFRRADKNRVTIMQAADLEATGQLLTRTLADFGVTGKLVGVEPGPVVTVFEYEPDAGVKQTRITTLIDDLALALRVDSIFIHPVRGKRALGIQVPNVKRETVFLGDILASDEFKRSESPLTFAMGKSLNGTPVCTDLTGMPHLLAAGSTGSGKSVAINSLLCSVIMKASPDDVRMILVDPKMLELSVYEGIPHLLMPVITDPVRASLALKWAAQEMDKRYQLMQFASVRNIAGFNEYWDKASESKREELRLNVVDQVVGRLPYIMLVIDELADLMLMAPKDVESSIQRLAQKARASGIHLVLATQRPSVDVITGVIKANLPCRVAFQVVSKHDSRTILDLGSAEKLLGKGDMLFQKPGMARLERLQGALVGDEEVLNLVANLKSTYQVKYDETITNWIDTEIARQNVDKDGDDLIGNMDMNDDVKFEEAVHIASSYGVVSASFLQRHLKIGYNRAARMVEFMESKGMVAKADGAKPRKWLGGGNISPTGRKDVSPTV